MYADLYHNFHLHKIRLLTFSSYRTRSTTPSAGRESPNASPPTPSAIPCHPSLAGRLRRPRHSEAPRARELEDDDDLLALRPGQDDQRAGEPARFLNLPYMLPFTHSFSPDSSS